LEITGKSLAVGHDRECGLPSRRWARYGNAGKKPRAPPRIRRPCPATSPFVNKGSAHGDLIRDLSIPQPANMD